MKRDDQTIYFLVRKYTKIRQQKCYYNPLPVSRITIMTADTFVILYFVIYTKCEKKRKPRTAFLHLPLDTRKGGVYLFTVSRHSVCGHCIFFFSFFFLLVPLRNPFVVSIIRWKRPLNFSCSTNENAKRERYDADVASIKRKWSTLIVFCLSTKREREWVSEYQRALYVTLIEFGNFGYIR